MKHSPNIYAHAVWSDTEGMSPACLTVTTKTEGGSDLNQQPEEEIGSWSDSNTYLIFLSWRDEA